MILLSLKKGEDFVEKYRLADREITIGRQKDSDIVLKKTTISRKHAVIKIEDNGYTLVDHSAFGTNLNKQLVKSHVLKVGDVISIFPFTITVEEINNQDGSQFRGSDGGRDDERFDPELSEKEIDRIMSVEAFKSMDQDRFPPGNSLRNIIAYDTAVRHFSKGEIIIRQGDYGLTAFYIMSGAVQVDIGNLPMSVLGHRESKRKTWTESLSQLWKNPKLPEARDLSLYDNSTATKVGIGNSGSSFDTHVFVQDISAIINPNELTLLEAGEFFGEVSVLGRTPRTTTIIAKGHVELLEIRWKGLRSLRKYNDSFRNTIDELYRERNLKVHLLTTPMFSHLEKGQLKKIVDETTFETFGNFDWNTSFNKYAKRGSEYTIDSEPIVVREGEYPNGLVLIRSGFARVSKKLKHGHHTISYLGRGDVFGLEELAHNWRNPSSPMNMEHSLRAIGYVDILAVPTPLIEEYVFPSMLENEFPETQPDSDEIRPFKPGDKTEANMDQSLLEFIVEDRFINGTATMMIDLDRCTRCDDCVRACAVAHDNNPRFIRHGKKFDHFMIANACMHCSDPVCMIGCPTGAIHRNKAGGQIIINDITCIGCGTCANSCPYDNIRMVEISNSSGESVLEETTHAPVRKATKCDLCVDQLGGPACQRACPHDALGRVEMRDPQSLTTWLNR